MDITISISEEAIVYNARKALEKDIERLTLYVTNEAPTRDLIRSHVRARVNRAVEEMVRNTIMDREHLQKLLDEAIVTEMRLRAKSIIQKMEA